MAIRTSTQTGNWADASTWGGNPAPGDGDTAIIANAHVVTIAPGTSVTVGDPVNPTTPAVQTATAGGGTGRLIIGAGATFTFKGNIVQGNANWVVNASAVLNYLHATHNGTWQIADGNNQANALLTFNGGTGANRITVQSTGAAKMGGFGWFGVNWSKSGQMQATGVTFNGIGTASLPFLTIQGSAAYIGEWTDCQFVNCGMIQTSNLLAVGATFKLVRTTFRTPASSTLRIVELNLAAGVHTGIVFDRVRWEGTFYVGGAGASGVVWDNFPAGSSYGATGIPLECTSDPHSATVNGLFLFNKIAASGNPSSLMNGTINKLCSMRTGGVGNPHALQIGVRQNTVINGGVFEFGFTDESGDQLQVVINPAAVRTFEIKHVIQPPGPDGTTGAGAFLNVSHAGSSANNRINVHHNTVFVSAISATVAGLVIVENTTLGAGVFAAIRSNIAYRSVLGAGWVVFQVNGALDNGSFTNVDYNNRYRLSGDGYQPADAAFANPSPPGPNDLTVDPDFVDPSRRFLSWGMSIDSSKNTLQLVFDEVMKRNDDTGFNPAFELDAFYEYMRAGFTPENSALATAAHDGTSIGAVAVVVGGNGGNMALKNLTLPTLAGTAQAMTAANAGGDSYPIPTAIMVRISNASGANRTVTFVAQKACNHGVLHNGVVGPIATGTTVNVRIDDVARFQDSNGRVQMTYDSEVGLTTEAFAVA